MRMANRSIRWHLIGAATVIVIPLVAGTLWSASVSYDERSAELREVATSTVRTVQAYLDWHFEALDAFSSALTQHPAVQGLDRARCDRLFAELLRGHPHLLNIALTGRDGYAYGTGVAQSATPGFLGDRPYIQQALSTGRPVVGEYLIGRFSRMPTVVFAYPVKAANAELVGVLGLALNLTRLQDVFQSIPLPAGSVVTLTDRSSRILARSLEPERFIGQYTEPFGQALEPSDVPRTVTRVGADGVHRIFGNAPVDIGPWLLSVGIPVQVANARARASWWRTLATAAAGGLAYLLLAVVLSRALARPVGQLEAWANRIAQGDLTPPRAMDAPNRELAGLRDAFVTMADRLAVARETAERQLAEERRIRDEVQALQRQTIRQERLAAVGQLVSGVAHELNNPLQVIAGCAELVEREHQLPEGASEDLRLIQSESARARDIIRSLLSFAGDQARAMQIVDLGAVIASVVRLRRTALELNGITLEVEAAPTPPVMAVFSELQQVVLNFIVNAEQALLGRPGAKRIDIRLSSSDGLTRLEVADNGHGVRAEDESKLFQPFFTTRPAGTGTGLGLSVSYGIVESHGGTIGYRETPGGGATFYMQLPTGGVPENDLIGRDQEDGRRAALARESQRAF